MGSQAMSNEYFFGLSKPYAKRLSAAEVKRRERIAEKHGCDFIHGDMPDGYKYWFAGPNRGTPFDGALAAEVMAEVNAG